MNWSKIESLLAECAKQPGTSVVPENIGLGSYGDVLKRHNGVEGFVGAEQYLMLWSAEQIPELNAAYHVGDYVQGIVLIGTDGGDTGYGRDKSTGKFGSLPLVGMSRAGFQEMGSSFEEFLEQLANE